MKIYIAADTVDKSRATSCVCVVINACRHLLVR